jgi:hypothetical protein
MPPKNLKANLKDLIDLSARVFKTPSSPKTLIICPKDGHPLISREQQKQFRSPEIANSVRELSKVADGATEGHFKSLLLTI